MVLAVASAACSATHQVGTKESPTGTSCAFLSPDVCKRLEPADTGKADVMGLRYVNPNAQWTHYKKILLAPVGFWGGDDTSVSKEDQIALTNYFDQALRQALTKKLQVVQAPGPATIEIDVALADVGKATPVLRTVSMVAPQAHASSTLKYVAAGTYAFVGGAQAEAKLSNALSGEILGAGIDRHVGGGAETAAQGDAEKAMNAWAEKLAERLSAWTSGAARP